MISSKISPKFDRVPITDCQYLSLTSTCDIVRIYAKSRKFRYVDELQKYKDQRIMNFLGGCPTSKLTQIIADMKWIHYAYLRRFMIVKPKNQKEVNHENLASYKDLDRLSRDKFEKKIRFVPTGGSLTNFALNLKVKS